MRIRKGAGGVAVTMLMMCAGWAGAEDLSLTPKYMDDAPARKPLMGLLDRAGLANSLDAANINIFGFVEGSYTYNFNDPAGEINVGRVFDFENDKVLLNQLDLTVERTVDVTKGKWDLGGRMEWIYGADAGLIHSNGLFDWYDGSRSPENQFDLNQAYLDLAIPVGNGLRLRGGKFVTLMGQETINPTTNALYSHSYLFGFAIPFTHTGVMGTYALNDNWTVEGGFFRGWEQSAEDNNDSLSFHAKVAYTSTDKTWGAILQAVTGPERADSNSDYRTVIDAILTLTPDPNGPWTFAVNGDYGWEASVPGIGDSQWYGVAGYAGYKVNSMFTVNGRGEWFNDEDGARGLGTTVYEATLGLAITPFPNDALGSNLKIRPEIRYDYAQDDLFNGGADRDQVTVGIDAYFTY